MLKYVDPAQRIKFNLATCDGCGEELAVDVESYRTMPVAELSDYVVRTKVRRAMPAWLSDGWGEPVLCCAGCLPRQRVGCIDDD